MAVGIRKFYLVRSGHSYHVKMPREERGKLLLEEGVGREQYPLSERGIEEATLAGRHFRNFRFQPKICFYDIGSRSEQTLRIILKQLPSYGRKVCKTDDLLSKDRGLLYYFSSEWIRENCRGYMQWRQSRQIQSRPAADGETIEAFEARIRNFYGRLTAEEYNGQEVLVVASVSVIRKIQECIHGREVTGLIPNCGIITYDGPLSDWKEKEPPPFVNPWEGILSAESESWEAWTKRSSLRRYTRMIQRIRKWLSR